MEIHDHNGQGGAPNPPAGANNYRISKELGTTILYRINCVVSVGELVE